MRKLIPLLAVTLITIVSLAIAAEVKTITGDAVCAKCALKEQANVLIFPNLHAAHIATRLMGSVAEATVVGPILMGMRSPVNSLQPTASVEDIVNLASITVLQAQKEY